MPRHLAVLVLAAAAVTGGAHAQAAAPKPVKMTYYLHGAQQLGDVEQSLAFSDALTMDKTKPSGAQERSKQVVNYTAGPNDQCTNNTFFPFWDGAVSGTLKGTATVTLFTTASPGSELKVRLFNTPEGGCNDAYEAPIAEKTVTVPQGDGKVVVALDIKRRAKPIKGVLRLLASNTGDLGDVSQVRVRYDAVSAPSSLAFTCEPKPGKKAC